MTMRVEHIESRGLLELSRRVLATKSCRILALERQLVGLTNDLATARAELDEATKLTASAIKLVARHAPEPEEIAW